MIAMRGLVWWQLTWHTFDTGQVDTVSCAPDGSCWASGDLGRVAILQS
jgi:hypothetical protein